MKRSKAPLLATVVLVPLAACEPVGDLGDPQTRTRFGAPELDERFDARAPEDAPEDAIDGRVDPEPELVGDESELRLRHGFLRGDLGPVLGVEDEATELTGYSSESWSSVTTTVLEEQRVAMTIFEVMGPMEGFEAGRTYRYGWDGYDAENPGAPWLAVIGCSAADDPEDGFDFDQGADEVDVRVTEVEEGVLEFAYDARFSLYDDDGFVTGQHTMSGRFTWVRGQ